VPKPPIKTDDSADAEATTRLLLGWFKKLPPGAALGMMGCASFFAMIRYIPVEITGDARTLTVAVFNILAMICACFAGYAVIREVIRRA
jgi:hypothetical protein